MGVVSFATSGGLSLARAYDGEHRYTYSNNGNDLRHYMLLLLLVETMTPTPEQKQEELIDLTKCVMGVRSLLGKNPYDEGLKVVERVKLKKLTGEIPVCASSSELSADDGLTLCRQLNALPSPVGVIAGGLNDGEETK